MKRPSFKARNFLKKIRDAERSLGRMMNIGEQKVASGGGQTGKKIVQKNIEFNLQKLYEQGMQNVRNLEEQKAKSPIDPIQSEAYNFFVAGLKKKASEKYLQDFAKLCLDHQGLYQKPKKSVLNEVWGKLEGIIYKLERHFAGNTMPHDLLKQDLFWYDLYRSEEKIASTTKENLKNIKALSTAEYLLFQKLFQRISEFEVFPTLEKDDLKLSLSNINAALQCTWRYQSEREKLLKFFAEKEFPIRFPGISRYRIYLEKDGQKIGYDIYTDLPEWQEMIKEPGFSLTMQLLKYANISQIGARLSRTYAFPFAEGFTQNDVKDLQSFLEKEKINLKEWAKAEVLKEKIPLKQMPKEELGELDLLAEIF
ncbi:hypothetical protein ACFL5G_03660 [Candidatus Margulisiibacteriota bacterium]